MSDPADARARWIHGAPRWYVVANVVLVLGVIVGYLVMGGEVTWGEVLVASTLAGLAVIAGVVMWLVHRGQETDPSDETNPPYGAVVFSGAVWIIVSIWSLASAKYLFGVWCLGFGALTLTAYGPPWLKARRARRRAAAAEFVEGKPPGGSAPI